MQMKRRSKYVKDLIRIFYNLIKNFKAYESVRERVTYRDLPTEKKIHQSPL
jgi:hypothetical protein